MMSQMHESSFFLTNLLSGISTNHFFFAVAIIISTIVLEDTTVIVVGLLAAEGVVTVPIALSSLYAGIILGDIGVYWLGYFAGKHKKLGKYVGHDYVAPFRDWLQSRFVLTVATARFIPGSRIPTYAASGYFNFSFIKFISTIVSTVAVWTTFLFTISYLFGSLTSGWLREVRWGIVIIVIIIFFYFARHNLRSYLAKKSALPTSGEINGL